MTRIVGIDTGAVTGLAALDIGERTLPRWAGSHLVYGPSARVGEESHDPAIAVRYRDRLAAAIGGFSPSSIAIEEPRDAQQHWAAGRRDGRAPQRDTAFGQGAHYATALFACELWREGLVPPCRVYPYLVRGNAKRLGWMPLMRSGKYRHIVPRDLLLKHLRHEAGLYGASDLDTLPEHVLMAFGVALHHIRVNQVAT